MAKPPRLASLKGRVSVADLSRARISVLGGDSERARGSTTARGYGWEWQQRRERVLKRDLYQCQECKRQGLLTAALHVDHVTRKADGGSDDDSNLQSLCKPCHELKTQAENVGCRGPLR